jgi:hypothetical protein
MQVVVIPTPAVQRGPNGTFAYVVRPDEHVSQRPIAVAHQSETQSVIARGIAAGDQVVTTGFSRLKDGASVTVATPQGQAPAADAGSAEVVAKAEGRRGIRTACADDIQKFCANVERRGAIRACLQASAAHLSEGCKAAAAKMRKAEGSSKE